MTKPLPYDCIKKQKEISTLRQFNLILENISIDNKIGHLFVINIKFSNEAADEKVLLFSEIYTPIFEKKKVVKHYERSAIQLM